MIRDLVSRRLSVYVLPLLVALAAASGAAGVASDDTAAAVVSVGVAALMYLLHVAAVRVTPRLPAALLADPRVREVLRELGVPVPADPRAPKPPGAPPAMLVLLAAGLLGIVATSGGCGHVHPDGTPVGTEEDALIVVNDVVNSVYREIHEAYAAGYLSGIELRHFKPAFDAVDDARHRGFDARDAKDLAAVAAAVEEVNKALPRLNPLLTQARARKPAARPAPPRAAPTARPATRPS